MLEVSKKARACPPRFALPPETGGFLARIWASWFASGALIKLIANREAPWCKTSTPKKPPVSPHSGGQCRRRGGLSSRSARPSKRAKHQPTNQRQVCPPPETVGRDTGGPRTSDSEGRGGRGGRVLALCKTVATSKTPTSRNSVTFPTAGSENDRSARKDLVQVVRVSGKRRLCDAARRKALTCGKSLVDPALGTGEVHSKPHRYCFFDDERAQA